MDGNFLKNIKLSRYENPFVTEPLLHCYLNQNSFLIVLN